MGLLLALERFTGIIPIHFPPERYLKSVIIFINRPDSTEFPDSLTIRPYRGVLVV